jgi:NADH-quinone oxidoreductase subunit M
MVIPFLLLMIIFPAMFLGLILALRRHAGSLAVLSGLVNFIITIYILFESLISGSADMTESFRYIPSLGITLDLRVNLFILVLLLMSSAVILVTALSGNIKREREVLSSALLVLFQIGATGLFLSGNLFVFFIFWDIGVIAPFFMINVLGSANRKKASYKFIVYEIFASAMLLLGIILVYFYSPGHSLNLNQLGTLALQMPAYIQHYVFFLFFIAFMINMPIFPLHSWLPDAHTEASTQGSMVLSGVLTKFGGFGMLIIFTSFAIAKAYAPYVAVISAVSAFYAVFLIMQQTDIKRIVAYTTIIEMSIIMFSITTLNNFGVYGALYGMLAHGLVVAVMFLSAGVIEHVFFERNVNVLRGIAFGEKLTSYVFLAGIFAVTGVPLTASFIADVLMFIGAINAFGYIGVIPLFSLVLLGGFLYFVINRSFFSTKEHTSAVDFMGFRQKAGYFILLALILAFGVMPFIILRMVNYALI